MKVTKTVLAAAIAGFAAAPMMASADTVLSGVVQVKYSGQDTGLEDDPATPDVDEAEPDEINMAAGDVRVGLTSEHALSSGLIGYGSVQLNVDDLTGDGGLNESIQAPEVDTDGSITDADAVELTSAATVASDNVYVGVKGGFGDVRLGEIPLAVEYGQVANDIHDVAADVIDGLSYTGTFGPVSFGLNHSLAVDSDMFGAGVKFNFAGATVGVGFEDRDEITSFSAGASYGIAGFTIAGHVWSKGQLDIETEETDAGGEVTTVTNSLDDTTALAIQVGYAIAGVDLGLTFSNQTTDTGPDEVVESIVRVDAGYDLGGDTVISTRIQNASDDVEGSDDKLEYRVMLSKSF